MTNELFEAYKGQLSPKEARAFAERVTKMTPQQKKQLSDHLGTMFHEIRNKHIKPKEDIMMTAQIGGEFKASDMFVPTIEGEKISYEGLVPVDQQTYVVRDQPTRNPVPQRSTPQRSSSTSSKTARKSSPQTSKVGVPAMLARPQEQPVKLSGIQDLPRAKAAPQDFNWKMTGAITSLPQEKTNKFRKIEVEGQSLLLDPSTGYAYSRNPNGTYRVRGNFETPITTQEAKVTKTVTSVPKKPSTTTFSDTAYPSYTKNPNVVENPFEERQSPVQHAINLGKNLFTSGSPVTQGAKTFDELAANQKTGAANKTPTEQTKQNKIESPRSFPYSPSTEQPYSRYRMVDDFESAELLDALIKGRRIQDYATPDTYRTTMDLINSNPYGSQVQTLRTALSTPGLSTTEKENLIYEGVDRGDFSLKDANTFLRSNNLPPIIRPVGVDLSNRRFDGNNVAPLETEKDWMANNYADTEFRKSLLTEKDGKLVNTRPGVPISSDAAFYYVTQADPKDQKRRLEQVRKYLSKSALESIEKRNY